MFGATKKKTPQQLYFLLIPSFSMMAFTSSVEPLRAANMLSSKSLYSWKTVSLDGQPVAASNGIPVQTDGGLDIVTPGSAIFVCSGIGVERYKEPAVINWLRQVAREGAAIGGVCTAPLILARAGLLEGYRCTVHWENMEGFVEEFPELEITATLFEVDRNRYTCSGGTAPLDMMIYAISQDHGSELAIEVAELMLHTIVRHPHDPQRMSVQYRTGVSHPKLLAAIAYMEAYLENPVTLSDLAKSVDLSNRQLERLFRTYLGKTPSRYYLELRLRRARLLLLQTSMPILQIAVACGFTSASHFARCYRDLFSRSPRSERSIAEMSDQQSDREGV